MKNKKVLLGSSIIIALSIFGILYIKKKNKKKEVEKVEDQVKNDFVLSPEEILDNIISECIYSGDYKNERDLLDIIIAKFFKNISNYDWMEICPKNLSDLIVRLEKLGLQEKFESDLEKKYKTGK